MRVHLLVCAAAGLLVACGDRSDPLTGIEPRSTKATILPPATLTTIPVGSGTARIWSYVSDNLVTPQDPVNLVFTGKADPRAIRNALLGLDGTRTPTFPGVFPFTCTWSDAIGGLMEGFEEVSGWSGGAVQLQCGGYGPIRFHLRLFKMGGFTVGNAHFEMVIPGTAGHQVLSWELAEQLVTYDMVRSGLLGDAPGTTGSINAAPFYRSIPAIIYNGMPVELKALLGGPLGDVESEVGIATDGQATTFSLVAEAPAAAARTHQEFVLTYGQVIPKPFCASGPADFVWVEGPVTLRQDVTVAGNELRQVFRASGELQVVPIDITTGQPSGLPFRANVSEEQESRATGDGGTIIGLQLQQLLPASQPGAGQLRIQVNVGPGRAPKYTREVSCH
jgi:hypothetical protein